MLSKHLLWAGATPVISKTEEVPARRKLTFKETQVNKYGAREFQEGMGATKKMKGDERTECLLRGPITLALC